MSTRNLRSGGFPWGFVLGAYAGSWAIWIAGWYLVGQPRQIDAPGGMMMVVLAGSFVPGLAAAITTAFEGGGALKAWFRAFIHVRCGWRAYAAALVPFPAALLLLTAVFGYTPIPAASGGMTPASCISLVRSDLMARMQGLAFLFSTQVPVSLAPVIAAL